MYFMIFYLKPLRILHFLMILVLHKRESFYISLKASFKKWLSNQSEIIKSYNFFIVFIEKPFAICKILPFWWSILLIPKKAYFYISLKASFKKCLSNQSEIIKSYNFFIVFIEKPFAICKILPFLMINPFEDQKSLFIYSVAPTIYRVASRRLQFFLK